MIIYPAIDIKDGRAVRLVQGEASQVTVYESDPVVVAQKWQIQGAQIIHVIDLDGAMKGAPHNFGAVKRISQTVDVPIQFGGGVREIETIHRLFDAGVSLVVLGTAVIVDIGLVKTALNLFGERIVVGIDARHGKVAIEGWRKATDKDVVELAVMMEDMGASRIVYTDISKDGMLVGPNLDGIRSVADSVDVPIIASGGVSSLDDIRALKELEPRGVEGVIVGKALYERAFTLPEAIKVAGDAG